MLKNVLDFKIIVPVLVAMVVFAWVIAPMMKANGNGKTNGTNGATP